jgi:hypothetical protein
MKVEVDSKLRKHLLSRGLPPDILGQRPFDIEPFTTSISSEVEGLKTRRQPKAVQLLAHKNVVEQPFSDPYLYLIGSSPNDAKAKCVAAHIMSCATQMQLDNRISKTTKGRQTPLWHTLTGSWQDKLRDRQEDQPSMLIISNITVDSTAVKLEKLRDLCELYSNIPRIIVFTGTDPITFANTRLRLAVNHVLSLATARQTQL